MQSSNRSKPRTIAQILVVQVSTAGVHSAVKHFSSGHEGAFTYTVTAYK